MAVVMVICWVVHDVKQVCDGCIRLIVTKDSSLDGWWKLWCGLLLLSLGLNLTPFCTVCRNGGLGVKKYWGMEKWKGRNCYSENHNEKASMLVPKWICKCKKQCTMNIRIKLRLDRIIWQSKETFGFSSAHSEILGHLCKCNKQIIKTILRDEQSLWDITIFHISTDRYWQMLLQSIQ